MKTDTKERILQFIDRQGQVRVHELVREFGLSQVAIHKQLKDLLGKRRLFKIGKPPLVYYQIKKTSVAIVKIDNNLRLFLDKHYLYISPLGEILAGTAGFSRWLKEINQEKKLDFFANRYRKIRQQANGFFNQEDLIELTGKLKSTFTKVYPDRVFCSDFYSLPEFGKTRLGNLVLYAKQSQSRRLVKQLATETRKTIQAIIRKFKIEAIAFVPATIPRKLQFLTEYALELTLALPVIQLVKVYSGEIVVAQKTLVRLEERVVNARETILIDERKQPIRQSFGRVLVIDDAVGSGATVNELAAKLKAKKIANKVIGYAIVGSFKGFDVIREV